MPKDVSPAVGSKKKGTSFSEGAGNAETTKGAKASAKEALKDTTLEAGKGKKS